MPKEPASNPTPAQARARRNTRLGHLGETAATQELERRGYRTLTRNYRCPQGEADVVAEEGECLVFVEVKTRSSLRYGLPQEAVGWAKQQRLGRAALHYCSALGIEDRPLRFDVVEVVLLRGEIAAVEVIPNAFTPDL